MSTDFGCVLVARVQRNNNGNQHQRVQNFVWWSGLNRKQIIDSVRPKIGNSFYGTKHGFKRTFATKKPVAFSVPRWRSRAFHLRFSRK
jgi:hypothetical protein